MEEITVLEMNVQEMVQFLKYLRDDVIVNVILDEKRGGEEDDRREEVQA